MNKHRNHQLKIEIGPYSYNTVTHQGKLVCKKCNKFIKWINNHQIELFEIHYKDKMTLDEFLVETINYPKK